MLDVHAPHEKMNGVGDFLLHLLTITVGLLIALGLEGCVERVHHRHQREEADTNLRQELGDNAKELVGARDSMKEEKRNLVKALQFLTAVAGGSPGEAQGISLSFNMQTLSDASWRTASATGVLNYMEYKDVQGFATAYRLQDQFVQLQGQTLDEFLELQSYVIYGFDPKKLTPADAQAASADVRRALAHLTAMEQIGDALGKVYEEALHK